MRNYFIQSQAYSPDFTEKPVANALDNRRLTGAVRPADDIDALLKRDDFVGVTLHVPQVDFCDVHCLVIDY